MTRLAATLHDLILDNLILCTERAHGNDVGALRTTVSRDRRRE
ncbi:hypothetical protein [Streptomyces sp. NPDC093544]|jgi:hypothetical protein